MRPWYNHSSSLYIVYKSLTNRIRKQNGNIHMINAMVMKWSNISNQIVVPYSYTQGQKSKWFVNIHAIIRKFQEF